MNRNIFTSSLFIGIVLSLLSCGGPAREGDKKAETTSSDSLYRHWKMGVVSWSFHKFSFDTALQKMDSTGARFVEISAGFEMGEAYNNRLLIDLSPEELGNIKTKMADKGLKMVSTYADGHDIGAWKRNFEFAKSMDLEFITGEPLLHLLDGIDSLAGIYNIKVAIHNHWKGLSRYWHPDSVLQAIQGRPNIKACADLGHWIRSGLDPAACIKQLEGHILSIHMKDIGEFDNVKAEDVVVGKGAVDFKKVVQELRRQKFNGMIYAECELNWYNNVPDVIESFHYFNQISDEVK